MNKLRKKNLLRAVSRYIMVLAYVAAGSYHFIHPGFYREFMPSWVPAPDLMIALSGVFEILFALLILPVSTRRAGAWGIILVLIGVFPANIQLAINYTHQHHPYLWLSIVRLPFQFLLIWWAYTVGGQQGNPAVNPGTGLQ